MKVPIVLKNTDDGSKRIIDMVEEADLDEWIKNFNKDDLDIDVKDGNYVVYPRFKMLVCLYGGWYQCRCCDSYIYDKIYPFEGDRMIFVDHDSYVDY